MFLKHRRGFALLLLLLAAVSLTAGVELIHRAGLWRAEPEESIRESTYTVESTCVTECTEAMPPAMEGEPEQEETVPTTLTEAPQDPVPSSVGAVPPSTGKILLRILGFFLSLSGIAGGVVGIFVIGGKESFPGIDFAALLLAAVAFLWESIPLWHEKPVFLAVLIFVLYLFLRELWSWIRNRCRLRCCLFYRLLQRCGLPRRAFLAGVGWCLLLFAVLLLVLLLGPGYLPAPGLLFALGLGLTSLWCYASDLQHLLQQLQGLCEQQPVCVKEGFFAEREEQLSKLQSLHEKAVQTAVTGERFKVELISNVSHDLRTPLTSILGYGELLRREQLSPEGRAQLEGLNQKAGYMRDLVEDLFELTKVSSGAVETKMEQIDLIRLLEQSVGLLEDRLAEEKLLLRRHYEVEKAPVLTDGTRLHQVFFNLLGNAVKYALPGTRIYLELKETEDRYHIRLTNTASYEMNFAPEEILQRFARGDQARSTEGSGLGLAIAQTYTQSVGGSFRIIIDGDQFNALVELPKIERNL